MTMLEMDQYSARRVQTAWRPRRLDHPYITMKPAFEAEQIRVFGEMAHKGYIYKGKKTVYWCPHCETALAEAEIEYADQKTPTIYVKIPLVDAKDKAPEGAQGKKTSMVIWTTTPWTIPQMSLLRSILILNMLGLSTGMKSSSWQVNLSGKLLRNAASSLVRSLEQRRAGIWNSWNVNILSRNITIVNPRLPG